jgi:hypothetical protein
MSDTPSTNVHELAERIIKLLGVTPDEHTMWQLINVLGRFREAVRARCLRQRAQGARRRA